MEYLMYAVPVGIGATALMDVWGVVRQPLFGIPRMDLALVGRWVGRMMVGEFRHEAISNALPVPGERLIGWMVHYLIGIMFAALLLAIAGPEWVTHPKPGPAVAIGIGTTVAPLLIMQPAMGVGRGASNASRRRRAQLHSLVSHVLYGLGLYLAGWLNCALLVM
jgi:hypothetical protein